MREIGTFIPKSPVCIAAGPWQLTGSLKPAGALFTKTVTPAPVDTNEKYLEVLPDRVYNDYGLANPGIDTFVRDYAPALASLDIPVFISVAIFTPAQMRLLEKLNGLENVVGFELNVSCPNIEGNSFDGGWLNGVRGFTEKPIVVKLPPDPWRIKQQALEYGWADGLTVGNSVPALTPHGRTVGMSGPAIRPIVLRCIQEVRSLTLDLTLIACGGIGHVDDLEEYRTAGADLFQVGSAHLRDPHIGSTLAGYAQHRQTHWEW